MRKFPLFSIFSPLRLLESSDRSNINIINNLRDFLINIINIIREKNITNVYNAGIKLLLMGEVEKKTPDESLITPIRLKHMSGLLLHVFRGIT